MYKRLIRQMLARGGYQISRIPRNPSIEFGNFESLCHAYERESGCYRADPLRSRLLSKLQGTSPSEAYVIIKALMDTEDVLGDVCEFGVAQGCTSALMANEIRHTTKTLHLFDSFQGLPSPTQNDTLKTDIFGLGTIEAYAGTMREPIEKVLRELQAIDFPDNRFVIHAGFFEEILKTDTNLPTKVSCAYVDFDLYEPIRLVLELLHQRTATGSIIIVDDYNWFSTGVKAAVDEFAGRFGNLYGITILESRHDHFAVLTRH